MGTRAIMPITAIEAPTIPVVAASKTDTITTVSAKPPRRFASSRRMASNIFSVTPESFKNLAIKMNSGIATST
ncbi:hypothetical protein HSBAA_54270 [Vreelandella sulfidaeris]|uniref:Uncharacterized protein n=1 Tax=Vreelandella sulfidaeris TaxID=115553 RepID=A0A455UHI6_9GAMM|nr:hypothetical protein HSBAA_54270 [Halomonas sulfidaeris]